MEFGETRLIASVQEFGVWSGGDEEVKINLFPMPNTSLREAAPTTLLLRRRSVQVSTSAQ
ncbi:MAG: hypothetical protein ACYTXA_21890 [Nostoc sp.]